MKQLKAKRNGIRVGKRAMLAPLIAVAVMALSSCTTWNSFRQTFIVQQDSPNVNEISIGVIEPQSGRYADKGLEEIKGIELANSIYGSVDGYKVNIIKVDTQSSVSATKTAIQSLIEMKPVAIIGAAGNASSLEISEHIDDAMIPTITPSSTNPLITQNSRYYYRACMTESQMGEGLAEYAYEKMESQKIGIVSIKNDTSSAAMVEGFEEKVKELAGKKTNVIVLNEEITTTDQDMEDVIEKINYRDVDVCFTLLGAKEMDRFLTLSESKETEGESITYLGTRSWGEEDFVSMIEKHPGAKVVFPYESVLSKTNETSAAATEEAQKFQIQYANRYGSDDIPTDNAALGYDSYLLLLNAIHNAKSLEGKEIKAALDKFDGIKCATGVFSFDLRGNVRRSVTLSTIKDGKPVTEYITDSEASAKRLEDVETATEQEVEEAEEEAKR